MKTNANFKVADTLSVVPPAMHADDDGSPVVADVIDGAEFVSAKSQLKAEVEADIAECDRINGADDFFDTQEKGICKRLPAAYKMCRRANNDPAYGALLAEQLLTESGGTYRPQATKPWNLAARNALRPTSERAINQTYAAGYFYRHALMEDVPVEKFATWIEGRNMKASRDFVREREQVRKGGEPKKVAYPNLAKARTLKKDAAVAKILKETKDLAEAELASLFASRDGNAANA